MKGYIVQEDNNADTTTDGDDSQNAEQDDSLESAFEKALEENNVDDSETDQVEDDDSAQEDTDQDDKQESEAAFDYSGESDAVKAHIAAQDEKFKELQGEFTRKSQLYSELGDAETIKQKISIHDQLDELIKTNPAEAQRLLFGNQDKTEVDPDLANDPVYKQQLDQDRRMKLLEAKIQKQDQDDHQRQVNARIDTGVEQAKETYKGLFGKDLDDTKLGKVYTWMNTNKTVNGRAAVLDVFQKEYRSHIENSSLNKQKAKRKLGGSAKTVDTKNTDDARKTSSDFREVMEFTAEQMNIEL